MSLHLPHTHFECLGHKAQEQTLLAMLARNQLAQTWLFHGAKGIGKATFAFQFAAFVMGAKAADAVGLFGDVALRVDCDHPVARRISAGAHPDLLIIEPELSGVNQVPVIKIEAARKASEFLSKTAFESPWRVVIIDGAEALNANAANALLKIIEEPPLNALMILITHHMGRLLPTLRSRCRKMAFLAPSAEHFVAILQKALETAAQQNDEDPLRITDDDLEALYLLADGSAGRALLLAQSGALSCYASMLEWLESFPSQDVSALHQAAGALDKNTKGSGFTLWGDLWCLWLTRLNLAGSASLTRAFSEAEEAAFAHLLRHRSAAFWLALHDASRQLIARAQALHLDSKQVITSLGLMTSGELELPAA